MWQSSNYAEVCCKPCLNWKDSLQTPRLRLYLELLNWGSTYTLSEGITGALGHIINHKPGIFYWSPKYGKPYIIGTLNGTKRHQNCLLSISGHSELLRTPPWKPLSSGTSGVNTWQWDAKSIFWWMVINIAQWFLHHVGFPQDQGTVELSELSYWRCNMNPKWYGNCVYTCGQP